MKNARGSDHDDLLSGTGGKNFLAGGEGADTVRGLDGDDRLKGGGGSDILDGGDGVDTLGFAGAVMGVTVDMVQNTARVGGDTDFFMNIEVVNGSEHHDHITGNGADNTLRGGVGDDVFVFSSGTDTLVGGAGDDVPTIDGLSTDFETGLYYDQNADTYRRYVEDEAGNVTYFGASLETLQFIDQGISTVSLFN